MANASVQPAYAAPAAQGAIAYYRRAEGYAASFIMVAKPGHTPRLGETFDVRGSAYRVDGFTTAREGIPHRAGPGACELVEVDGLPVARYLPTVSKPTPAQILEATRRVAEIAQRDPAAFLASMTAGV